MFSTKSTFLLAVLSISIRLASAIPPACLLAAINTQSNPADLPTLCGKDSSDVQQQIRDLCGDNTEAALDAYKSTCKQLGLTIPDETTSSTSKPSQTASATSKSTDKSKPSSTAESTADTTTDADVPKSTDKSKTDSTAESTKADSATDTEVPRSSSAASALYPVTFTSTFFDSECSCTKTSTISSTPIAASSGYVIATGNASPTGSAGPSGGLGSGSGSGPGSAATGSPILPSATNERGTSATPSSYTGAASKNLGASGVGILAIISLVLAL